jgi:hypothetical protein
MTTTGNVWPGLEELFAWLGEDNLSRNAQTQEVTAVEANAVHAAYSQWAAAQMEARTELKTLKKEIKTIRDELAKAQARTNRLLDESLLHTPASQGMASAVHKVKPRPPAVFDGSQDLEVVTRFLDEVVHYVRQGASACPSATLDNQLIDTVWRFLSVKIFRWFELEMSRHDIFTIPPANHDYGITWKTVKAAFRTQFVPVTAVSVVRKQWHALKFNKNEVLKFNRRALELIEILGGSLSITRNDPLWEEYLLKLPDMLSRDVTQQAQITRRISKEDLTLGDMMDVVVERTLPYLPAGTTGSGTGGTSYDGVATAGTGERHAPNPIHHDPMDLSNLEDMDLYTVDDEAAKRCFHCTGFGHLARQCPTPSSSVRPAEFRQKNSLQRDQGNSRRGRHYQQNGANRESQRESPAPRQPSQHQAPPRQPPKKNSAPARKPFGQKPFAAAGKLYMVGEDQRMYAVDDVTTGSGAYFGGSWADSEDDWESSKGPRVVELGDESDEEKNGVEEICEGAGKAKQ